MNKKIILTSVAAFATIMLVGCGSDVSEQAQKEAAQKKEQAQDAVQDANKNYEAEKHAVQEKMAETREEVRQMRDDLPPLTMEERESNIIRDAIRYEELKTLSPDAEVTQVE